MYVLNLYTFIYKNVPLCDYLNRRLGVIWILISCVQTEACLRSVYTRNCYSKRLSLALHTLGLSLKDVYFYNCLLEHLSVFTVLFFFFCCCTF